LNKNSFYLNFKLLTKKPMFLKKNQSIFLAKIRPPLDFELKTSLETLQTLNKSQSPDGFPEKSKKYHKAFSYSCFSNPSNTKICLNSRCLSGNLLNRSLNAKLANESENIDFDLVLEEFFIEFSNEIYAFFFIFSLETKKFIRK